MAGGKDDSIKSMRRYLHTNITLLRMCGFYSMEGIFTGEPCRSNIWESVFLCFLIPCEFFMMICELRTVFRDWSREKDHSIEAACVMFMVGSCGAQGWGLVYKRVEVRDLLRRLVLAWGTLNPANETSQRITESMQKVAHQTTIYSCFAVSACGMFLVRPYADLLTQYMTKNSSEPYNYAKTVLDPMYPFPVDDVWTFLAVVNFEQMLSVIMLMYWVSIDSLFIQCTMHIGAHFEILYEDLMNIVDKSRDEFSSSKEDRVVGKLMDIAERHIKLLELCDAIENIFSPITLIVMLVIAFIMCVGLFQFQKMLLAGSYLECLKYFAQITCLVGKTIVFCFFSSMLSDKTSLIGDAAYEGEWMNRSRKFNSILLLILMRSQKSFHCTAYGFFPVTIDRMTIIFKTAGSYFTLLKAMT
ncbi:odorant receptor 82a-like [Orussus abietinus]|uniref:odorant receptor 82a-like n=1 Tax=Orussus abietinus TaxID=222816 RepID=UPI000625E694|nr:odorant receptor 82a-like [Orussus abietinus]